MKQKSLDKAKKIFTHNVPELYNATLSGKKLLAKMLNEVKTANCFLSV
jgi:hypothetical protein